MRATLAIARRELGAFFRTPIGWLVIALYLCLSGVVFAVGSLRPGHPATMRDFFVLSNWLLIFVAPAVSMRLVAEERRTGTLEALMSSPVTEWQVVAGKFAAGAGFLALMLAPTLVYPAALMAVSSPSVAPIVTGYVGLGLLGMFYLALGLVFSALASSQVVAFLGALFTFLLLRVVAAQGPALVGPPWDAALGHLALERRLGDFGKGVIDSSHVVFFGAACVWLLTVAVVALAWRRWR